MSNFHSNYKDIHKQIAVLFVYIDKEQLDKLVFDKGVCLYEKENCIHSVVFDCLYFNLFDYLLCNPWHEN